MNTALSTHTQPSLDITTQSFDTSILAGTKSPNTIEQYKMHFGAYLRFAGTFAKAIQPATLTLWRQHLYETGYTLKDGTPKQYSVNAINQRLAAIRGTMAEAAQQGYIHQSTADEFKAIKGYKIAANKERRNAHTRTKITLDEMQAIVDAPNVNTSAGLMHRAFLMVLATSGLRITTACNLRYSQIEWHTDDDGNNGWVVWVDGKNQADEKPRALGKSAKQAIDLWLTARSKLGIQSDHIFTGFAGRGDRSPKDTPINRVSAWGMVQRYAKRLGLDHVKPHDFRRYVGTQLAKVDIRLAQNQLGHKRIETTAQNYILDSVKVGVTDNLVK